MGIPPIPPSQTQTEPGGNPQQNCIAHCFINVWKTQTEIVLGPFQCTNTLEHIDHAYGNSPGPESTGKTQIAAWKLDSIKGDPLEPRKKDNQPAETPASLLRISRPLASAVP